MNDQSASKMLSNLCRYLRLSHIVNRFNTRDAVADIVFINRIYKNIILL